MRCHGRDAYGATVLLNWDFRRAALLLLLQLDPGTTRIKLCHLV